MNEDVGIELHLYYQHMTFVIVTTYFSTLN